MGSKKVFHDIHAFSAVAALFLSFVFLASPFSARSESFTGSMQIKGSDTMVNLAQAWAEEFMRLHPESSIAVTGGGSGTGIAALINRTCDVAISSRKITAKETDMMKKKGISPQEHVLALDGIAVVVHPSNPLGKLSIDQLRDIFTGKISDWSQVGGKPGQIVLLSREVNSGTHVFFKEHVLTREGDKGHAEFAPSALLLSSSQAIADEVAQNSNAIGYYGMGYISAKQKTIAVGKTAAGPYLKPEAKSVRSGTYPISRPLFIYSLANATKIVSGFLRFAASPEGQKIVAQIDFVPIQ